MSGHDPLCPWVGLPDGDCDGCDLIAKTRDQIATTIEAQIAEGMERGWSFAALKAFEISAGIARGEP
jgi:hypothetical protein